LSCTTDVILSVLPAKSCLPSAVDCESGECHMPEQPTAMHAMAQVGSSCCHSPARITEARQSGDTSDSLAPIFSRQRTAVARRIDVRNFPPHFIDQFPALDTAKGPFRPPVCSPGQVNQIHGSHIGCSQMKYSQASNDVKQSGLAGKDQFGILTDHCRLLFPLRWSASSESRSLRCTTAAVKTPSS
jgi:hypothetical protein